LFERIIFFSASAVLVVWGIKKLAPESIQPTSDHSEVGAVHMPEERWAIDWSPTLKVEHELGIGKLNLYRFPVSFRRL